MQVINKDNKHFAMSFIVGDIRNNRVHGFYFHNRSREYITVNVDEVARIGPSKVRSKEPCSHKWLADHA